MNKDNTLKDGIYVVHNGRLVKLDGFEFGYEGMARWSDESVRVVEVDGRLILIGGAPDPEADKVATRTGAYRRLMPITPQPPDNARRYTMAADGTAQVKFFSTPAGEYIALAVTGWIECPYGKAGDIVDGRPFDHDGKVEILSVSVYREVIYHFPGRWLWDISLKRLG